MPRKKSVGGRSRGVSDVNRLMLEAERINKKFTKLEKAGKYGTYKSRELLEFISRNKNVEIKRSKRSGRHRVRITKKLLSKQEAMLIDKKFKGFLKSKASTPEGIKDIEENIRKKIADTIQEEYAGIDDEDIEMFYDILKHQNDEILQQIPPSEFYSLVMAGKEQKWRQRNWINVLSEYADLNSVQMRKKARKLYKKYVKK